MISIGISGNNSPYFGKDGDKYTFSQIVQRLKKEVENDVSLKLEQDRTKKDVIFVFGRGDLHLGILIERLRREGFEMTLNPPQVIYKVDEEGNQLEPIETITVEFEDIHTDVLLDMLQNRHGDLVSTTKLNDDRVRVIFDAPTRGLFGLRSNLIRITKGHVIIQSKLKGFEKYKGPIKRVSKGALLSMKNGKCTAYALKDAENHGKLYVQVGDEVYAGQVIGELDKEGGEVEVNPCKEKVLSNVRSTSKEENIKLTSIPQMAVEDAMVMLRPDELLEVTPKYIRIRKEVLDFKMRTKLKREGKITEEM